MIEVVAGVNAVLALLGVWELRRQQRATTRLLSYVAGIVSTLDPGHATEVDQLRRELLEAVGDPHP